MTEASKRSSTATARVFCIGELLEIILLNLPYKDLLRVQGVQRSWQSIILEVASLGRIIWKTALVPHSGSNPHFLDTGLSLRGAVSPEVKVYISRVLDACESSTRELLDNISSYTSAERQNALTLRGIQVASVLNVQLRGARPAWYSQMHHFTKVWCRVCDMLHASFNYGHLHPLIAPLFKSWNQRLCFAGYSTRILVTINIQETTRDDFNDTTVTLATLLLLAMDLRRMHRYTIKYHLGENMVAKPVFTQAMILDQNKYLVSGSETPGITLLGMIKLLASACKYISWGQQEVGRRHIENLLALPPLDPNGLSMINRRSFTGAFEGSMEARREQVESMLGDIW